MLSAEHGAILVRMSWLARGRCWLWFGSLAALACTTYSESPSNRASAANGGAATLGGQPEGGRVSVVAGGGMSSVGGSVEPGGSGGGAGEPSQGEAGAAACVAGDCCLVDPQKTEPGECGCGVADADSDTDGTLDCLDECPEDTNKVESGECGCGLPEQDSGQLASCTGLVAALIHRYDFEGGGKDVRDRVGPAHGTVEGLGEQTTLGDKGVLALVGNGSYVNLPNFLVSKLANATIEGWVSWNGGKPWQRVFDFGESNAASPEDSPLDGKDYLFLSTSTHPDVGGGSRFGYSLTGAGGEIAVDLPMPLAPTVNHVAGVVDTESDKLIYYLNGQKAGESPFAEALSSINDVNVWLGRSQYVNDAAFTGTYHEFRIYDSALTPQQIATSFAGGPDPVFLAQ